MKNRIRVLPILGLALVLGGCEANKPTPPAAPQVASLMDCIPTPTTACVDSKLNAISDEWTRNCVQGNINSKTGLVESMKNDTLTSADVQDMDELVKECINFKVTQPQEATSTTSTPLFNTFLSATAGSFVGSYLANSMFMGRMNYNTPQSNYSDYRTKYDDEKKRTGGSSTTPVRAATTKYDHSSVTNKAKAGGYSIGTAGKAWSAGGSSATSTSTLG